METLIIIPGWVNKYIVNQDKPISQFYDGIVSLLEKNFQVRLIEFPGFGQTPASSQPWQLDNFVAYLKEYIEPSPPSLFDQLESIVLKKAVEIEGTEEGKDKIYLLGHSFGGQVAAKFAYLYPEKVKKLILYNAACIRKQKLQEGQGWQKLTKFASTRFPFWRKIYYKVFVGQTDYLKLSPVMQQTMSNILQEDLTAILPQLQVETLVLWGSQDKITPLPQGLKIKRLIPDVKMIVHPGGHSFHLQDPLTFVQYIKNFTAAA